MADDPTSEDVLAAYRAAPLLPRWHPAVVRSALWTRLSLRRARAALRSDGVRARIPGAPRLPSGSRRGVHAVLRRTEPTCLERSLVLQTWLAAQGVDREVVVGVAPGGAQLDAHAWVDYETTAVLRARYTEMLRLPPPR